VTQVELLLKICTTYNVREIPTTKVNQRDGKSTRGAGHEASVTFIKGEHDI